MSNLKPSLGTCSWEPCWQPIARNLPREFVLGTRTSSWEPVLRTLAWEPVLAKLACKPVLGNLAWGPVRGNLAWELGALFMEPLLVNLFLRTLPGNPVLRTLLGNLFPGTLPGNPLACEPILGNLLTFLQPFLGNLFLGTLLGNLFLGTLLGNCTCSWEPGLGILACEPVPGKFDWKSCSWGG